MARTDLIVGDCVKVMRTLEPCSVDAIVTDPPYGLEFMGKDWDKFRVDDRRVPGWNGRESGNQGGFNAAPTVAFKGDVRGTAFGGGKRSLTFRCEGCGKRDQFKKPHACPDRTNWRRELIDPHAAPPTMLAFQEWTRTWALEAYRVLKPGGHLLAFAGTRTYHRMASGVEDAGFEIRDCIAWMYGSGFPKSLNLNGDWQGWGTALKPAYEPIVVARKPLAGTVAANVLEWGTGALNIDGCRIGDEVTETHFSPTKFEFFSEGKGQRPESATVEHDVAGRWPANLALDQDAAAALDEQSGETKDGVAVNRNRGDIRPMTVANVPSRVLREDIGYGDSGGASRFFYVAKVSSAERNAGLDGFEPTGRTDDGYGTIQRPKLDRAAPRENWTPHPVRNSHPTVKPIALMRWLTRLVTPPAGLILDPFAGSGTTGIAATLENFDFLGIEQDAQYAEIARARLDFWAEYGEDGLAIVRQQEASEALHAELAAQGQLSLDILERQA